MTPNFATAARERVAHVPDPGGNVIGVYEQPVLHRNRRCRPC
ncbi:MAG TPA: hypothetical protein VKF14_13655 [Candidatus Dormibacteraeota bacterium]|nr:hypothetical protein [Candidatus Dormibacteraeota bacterium]